MASRLSKQHKIILVLILWACAGGILVYGATDKTIQYRTARMIENMRYGEAKRQVNLGAVHVQNKNYAEAVRLFEEAVRTGYPLAQFNLGVLYYSGYGVTRDAKKAIDLFQQAAAHNVPEAAYYLGLIHQEGVHVPRDMAQARQWYERAVKLGFQDATVRLQDMATRQALINAPEQIVMQPPDTTGMSPRAMMGLGLDYLEGIGGQKNVHKGFALMQKAAENGLPEAQEMFGNLHDRGVGTPQNDQEALKWYRLAADGGRTWAMLRVGRMYATGKINGVNDWTESLKWYLRAAEARDPIAQAFMSWVYKRGQYGPAPDQEKATLWYNRALQQHADAMTNIAFAWLKEEHLVPRDVGEAFMWYQQGTQRGSLDAQIHLGTLYVYGAGVQKDMERGIQLWTQAAEKNHIPAQKYMVWLYSESDLVPHDSQKAVYWQERLIASGDDTSYVSLGYWGYFQGQGVEKNYKKAFALLHQAVQKKYFPAYKHLAYLYEYGYGVEQNVSEALRLYRACAVVEDLSCLQYLSRIYYGYSLSVDGTTTALAREEPLTKEELAAIPAPEREAAESRNVYMHYNALLFKEGVTYAQAKDESNRLFTIYRSHLTVEPLHTDE